MKELVQSGPCTACGACVSICPAGCITWEVDSVGVATAMLDKDSCLHCGLCLKACPVATQPQGHKATMAYAGWAERPDLRSQSASGGVAALLSSHVIGRGGLTSGAKFGEGYQVRQVLSDDIDDVAGFRNSKYTFSHMGDIYQDTERALKREMSVLFVGLPCQVAGLSCFLRARGVSSDGLTLVDLICHGITPPTYLPQHIGSVDPGHRADTCSLRDPILGTQNFYFTLRTSPGGELVYKGHVKTDLYCIGYHGAIAYRESCYSCPFASRERHGDLTLGDFPGLGRLAPYNDRREKTTCILVNTEKGGALLDLVRAEPGSLSLVERPVSEAYEFQPTLNHPIGRPPERAAFLEAYSACQDYDAAAEQAFGRIRSKNRVRVLLKVDEAKAFAMKLIPRPLKEAVKMAIRHIRGRRP